MKAEVLPDPLPSPAQAAALDAVFAALADPTRRAILAMLLEDDMAVTDVAEPFGISLAAISKHLATLAAAGLIVQERRGRINWCKLDPDGMRAHPSGCGASGRWTRSTSTISNGSCRRSCSPMGTEAGGGRDQAAWRS